MRSDFSETFRKLEKKLLFMLGLSEMCCRQMKIAYPL
jgi:DNA-directed RNA polymerase subunit N (RpoN/RPB10)